MRLNEILIEQQVDEAPQGMLSRLATKAKSFVPGTTGRQAKGDLEVGKEANWLKKQFDIYMGKIKKPATPQVVIDFLRKNNYPTGDAEQEMTKVTTGQKVGAAVGTGAAKAAKGVGKVAGAIGKGIGAVAKGAANLKKANTDSDQKADAENPAQTTPQPNAPTDQNKEQPATTEPDAQKQPAGNPDNNIAISGGKKKAPTPVKKVVNQSIDWSEATFIFEDPNAVLSGGQLDNIFMAAVRQAVARDEGGQKDTGTGVAPADAQGGGLGGAAKAAAAAAGKEFQEPGSSLPPEIKKQLETLPARDKQQLLKML